MINPLQVLYNSRHPGIVKALAEFEEDKSRRARLTAEAVGFASMVSKLSGFARRAIDLVTPKQESPAPQSRNRHFRRMNNKANRYK